MSVSDTTASVLVGCDPKHVRAKTSGLRSSHAVVVVDVFVSATNPRYATFRTHTHSHSYDTRLLLLLLSDLSRFYKHTFDRAALLQRGEWKLIRRRTVTLCYAVSRSSGERPRLGKLSGQIRER